ncbi:MAG: hypothetical protein C5B56_06900 [Proteobacteria bacterium]|nr:MAG: hypothetical protein C5B56_06900 [Pseudomonadota bacterium]
MAGKKALTGVAALTLFDIVAAHAQPAPVYNWTGFYFGGHAGYRWADVNGTAPVGVTPNFNQFIAPPTFNPLFVPIDLKPQNAIYGVHFGFNYVTPAIPLVGWEIDFSWGKGTSRSSFVSLVDIPNNVFGSTFLSATVEWQASFRGRVGYTWGPLLFYWTAGVSVMQASISGFSRAAGGNTICSFDFACTVFSFNSASSFSTSRTLVGGVVGGGFEYLLANGLMFRLEYLFADYGNVNFGNVAVTSTYADNFNCVCTITSTYVGNVTAQVTTQTVRAGISLKLP